MGWQNSVNSSFSSAWCSRSAGFSQPASSASICSRNFLSSTRYSSRMSAPLLRVDRLTKRFGGLVAVDRVSFEARRDEIVGLIGPNGAGKTTLLRLITKILKPDAGSIVFRGADITALRPWEVVERGIAGTFQNMRPFRHLPIIANVMVPLVAPRARRGGEWVKSIEAKAMDALEFVGISDMALEPASALSQGDLKRLEVARAIATEPELLLLDEPLGGLNPAESELLAKSIRRLHKGGRFGRLHSEGAAVLMIEHKLKELMSIVDRVIVVDHGEISADDAPAEVGKNPKVTTADLGPASAAARGARRTDRGHAVRRRAADARHGARAHVRSEAPRDRRAVARPRAAHPPGAVRRDRAHPRRGRAGAAGRAGGGAGVSHGLAQLRALAGPHPRAGQRRLTDGRRDAPRGLPWTVAVPCTGGPRSSRRRSSAGSAGIAPRSCRAATARGRAA